MATSMGLPQVVGYAASAVLSVRMLATGLALRPGDLMRSPVEPVAAISKAFVLLVVAVPLAAVVAIALCRLDGTPAAALLLVSVSVGPPVASITGARAEASGDRRLAATLALFTSALAAVAIPCWVWLLGRSFGPPLIVAPSRALLLMLAIVTVPFVLGLTLRRVADGLAARLASPLATCARVGLIATMTLALIWAAPALPRGVDGLAAATGAAFVLLATVGLSWWAAGDRGDLGRDRTVGRAALIGNPAQALVLIAALFPDPSAIAFGAALLAVRVLAEGVYERVSRWRRAHPRLTLRQRLA
jgi:predicted Na+-dependent transporter